MCLALFVEETIVGYAITPPQLAIIYTPPYTISDREMATTYWRSQPPTLVSRSMTLVSFSGNCLVIFLSLQDGLYADAKQVLGLV